MNDCWLPMTAATLLLLLLLLTAAADRSSSSSYSGGDDDEYDEYDDPYAYVPPYGQRLPPGRGQRPPPPPSSFGRPRYTGIAVLHLDEGTHTTFDGRTARGRPVVFTPIPPPAAL